MTVDHDAPWVSRYRAAVHDAPTPDLDRVVLAAVEQQSRRRRGAHRRRELLILGGVAAVAVLVAWTTRYNIAAPGLQTAGYGSLEGASRYHLLNVVDYSYVGPGINEGRP